MSRLDRSAHRVYEDRHREIAQDTRRRLRDLTEALDLQPEALRDAVIAAGLKAARLHAAECALAEHQLRTGHHWPAEDRLAREDLHDRQWEAALAALRAAIPEAPEPSGSEPGTAGPAEPRPPRSRYRPLASISRPQKG